MRTEPARLRRLAVELIPVLPVRAGLEAAGVVALDDFAEALNLSPVLNEERQRRCVRGLPVEVDERARSLPVGEAQAEVVLDELIGVKQPELGCGAESGKPSRLGSLVAAVGKGEVGRGDLRRLRRQVLGALRLDGDDLVASFEQDVEVRRDLADTVRALRLEGQRLRESGDAREGEELRVALPGRERVHGQSGRRPGRSHLPLELLAGPGAEGVLDLGARDPRQQVVLQLDDVAVLISLGVRPDSLKRSAESTASAGGDHTFSRPLVRFNCHKRTLCDRASALRAARAGLTREQRWADPVVGQLVLGGQAEQVRALFRLRAAGGSWSECARLMESRGVPNRKGEPFWLLSAVQAIIRNPVYRGEAYLRSKGKQAGDFVNPEAHEPIVDAILWRKAQPKQGTPRRSSEGALLAGILRCACCGRRLSPSGGYYRCRPRMVTGPECPAPASAPRVELEALVLRGFFDWLAYRPLAAAPPDLAPLEQALALGKAEEAKWKEAARRVLPSWRRRSM
jgi:hypothetical protein